MKINTWADCYPSAWKGLIVPESMAHPAKYSSRLIRRIYQHMLEEKWLLRGDRVIDPFGGVSLGALDAMRLGLHWTGIELESKFVDLGNRNINLWNSRFGQMPNWGSARLLQGDSRHLLELIGRSVQVSVSSPPYADGAQHTGGNDPHPEHMQGGQYFGIGITGSISSPPYADSMEKQGGIDPEKSNHRGGPNSQMNRSDTRYGMSDGQLGAMKANGFDAAVSSPPFLQSEGGTPEPKPGGSIDKALQARHAAGNKSANGYGKTDGQLSSMREGGFNAAVSSPPFTEPNRQMKAGHQEVRSETYKPEVSWGDGNLASMPANSFDASISSPPFEDVNAVNDPKYIANRRNGGGPLRGDYGNSAGQLGNDSGDDFWLAARAIVEQVYQALTPGAHAIWVVKNYVKNKQVVPFCDQWRQLCEAVGFVTLHEHHAMLVHHKGTQHTLEGGVEIYKTASKSFFRRLTEQKAALNKYWKSLGRAVHFVYLKKAHYEMWQAYNSLSDAEKRDRRDDNETPKNPPPNRNKIKLLAQYFAFTDSGEDQDDWNKETRIDYETVYCMEKRNN